MAPSPDNVSVPHPTSPSGKPQSREKKSFPTQVWELLSCFRTIQLAIILLSLLAVGVLIGVFMPQDGLVTPLEIKKQYGENYRLLKAFGLFNVYSSYWFITLEVLFFFNLFFGSFKWLKPAFLSATRKTFFTPEQMANAKEHGDMTSPETQNQTLEALQATLKKHRYGVYQDPENPNRLYATKGNFSRFGPVVAHFGILLLLIFSVMAAFTGFKAQKLASPGQTFQLMQSDYFMTNVHPTLWLGSVPTWEVRVKDFRIEYYPDHPETVKQYFCTLQILNPDKSVRMEKVISVNDPLNLEDVTFYQASFSPTGKLFLEINGQSKTVEINADFQSRPINVTPLTKDISLIVFPFFVQQDHVKHNHVALFLQKDGKFVGSAPGKMPTNLRLNEGESGQLASLNIKFVKPEFATGLQIKKAPEVPWMYLSYIIIMLGTVMCVFSQRQIWIAIRPHASYKNEEGVGQQVLFLFKTNRAKVSFMKELSALESALQKKWAPKLGSVSTRAPQKDLLKTSQEEVLV